MEPKRLIELTVGIVVGLVVFSAILMPVVNNAEHTASTTKYTNEGTGSFAELDLSETVTIIPRNGGYTINGENVNATGDNKYIYADTFKGAATIANTVLNVDIFAPTPQYVGYVSKIVISEGTATITRTIEGTDTEYTASCEWVIISDDAGDMTLCTDGAYTNGSFYATYPPGVVWTGLGFVAVVEDYALSSVNGASTTNGVMTDISENVVGSITTENYKSTVSVVYEDQTYDLGILAPKIVEITTPNDLSGMIGVIPILIIAGLIIGIVGVAISRRE